MFPNLKFTINPPAHYIECYTGSVCQHTINCKHIGPYLAVKTDANENFDFTANLVTQVDIICNRETITSNTNDVTFDGADLIVNFTALGISVGSFEYFIKVYVNDATEGFFLAKGRVVFSLI